MKRAFLVFGVIAALVSAVPASAQLIGEEREEKYIRLPHRFHIFVDGGIGLPTEPGLFNDYWNTAFQFTAGAGMSIFPWLEVNANYCSLSFSNNSLESKGKIGYTGVEPVEEGTVHTTMYWGSARFIAVPKSRTNPFVEIGVGYFSSSADDLLISTSDDPPVVGGVLRNSMESVSGMSFVPSVGIQYELNERWGAYSKYTYAINFNEDFAPGDLLLPVGATEKTIGDSQIISSIVVGLMILF